MFFALSTGFFLGLSLIVAIGAQNAFVLRQGILKEHIFYIALFCSVADASLIILGVTGISLLFNDLMNEYSKIIYGFSALWLFSYGVLRLRSALYSNITFESSTAESSRLIGAISTVAVITFANPHVYLDTVILIGSIAQQYIGSNKVYFAIGACSASFVWFFGIAYGARLLSPIMQKPSNWRAFDLFIASIMFFISFNLASQGGLF